MLDRLGHGRRTRVIDEGSTILTRQSGKRLTRRKGLSPGFRARAQIPHSLRPDVELLEKVCGANISDSFAVGP